MFDPKLAREECLRLASSDKGKHEYMNSRWDAHGAFIAGAKFQYDLMEEEIARLNRVINTYQIELQYHTDKANDIWDET